MSLFQELKRRKVLRVGAAYVVVSWVIIEVVVTLRELFPEMPLWLGQALIVLLVVGIVPVLIFSWFYELTPEGFKRDEDVDVDRSYSDAVGRRLIYLTIAGVFVGLGLFASTRTSVGPEIVSSPRVQAVVAPDYSVAVLPFANLSPVDDNKYFSDGLADVLRHTLARVDYLRVTPRRTSDQIASLGLQEIYSEWGISYVLEGSVQRAGDQVRIIAQLVSTRDGVQTWSEDFSRDIDDIFAMQNEIASVAAKALLGGIGLTGPDPTLSAVDTESFEAYDLYLRALAEGRELSIMGTDEAIRYLREALAIDPGFVEAKIELGWMLIQTLRINSQAMLPDVMEDVAVLAQQVLEDDPGNVTAGYLMVIVDHGRRVLAGDRDAWSESRPRYRALIDQAVDKTRMLAHFSFLLAIYEEYDAASEILESMREADPLNPSLHTQLADLYMFAGDYEKAKAAARRAIELDENSTRAIATIGQSAMFEGDIVTFIDSWLRGWETDPSDQDFLWAVADRLYDLGFIEEGDWFRDRVQVIGPNSLSAKSLELHRAIVTADVELATALSRRAVEEKLLRSSYWYAGAKFLLCNAANASEAAEVVEFIDAHLPGFAELDNVGFGRAAAFVRIECLSSLAGIYDATELVAAVNSARRLMTENVYKTAPQISLLLLVHEGKTALAIEEALDRLFSKHLTEALWLGIRWRELFADPAMAAVAADPRIQRELRRWEQVELELKDAVQAYFEERPELLTPGPN